MFANVRERPQLATGVSVMFGTRSATRGRGGGRGLGQVAVGVAVDCVTAVAVAVAPVTAVAVGVAPVATAVGVGVAAVEPAVAVGVGEAPAAAVAVAVAAVVTVVGVAVTAFTTVAVAVAAGPAVDVGSNTGQLVPPRAPVSGYCQFTVTIEASELNVFVCEAGDDDPLANTMGSIGSNEYCKSSTTSAGVHATRTNISSTFGNASLSATVPSLGRTVHVTDSDWATEAPTRTVWHVWEIVRPVAVTVPTTLTR